jgi:hypothetical protein
MTREEIKEAFVNIFTDQIKEDVGSAYEEEEAEHIKEFLDIFIGQNGGWEKFYTDLQEGEKNGIPIDTQFNILKKVLGGQLKKK